MLNPTIYYWKKKLHDAPAFLRFPNVKPQITNPSLDKSTNREKSLSFQLPTELTQKLKTLSKESEITIHTALLSAFSLLLIRYSRADDICIGSVINNKENKKLRNALELPQSTLIMRIQAKKNTYFDEFLQEVNNTVDEASHYQGIPFSELLDQLNIEEDSNHPAFIQAFLAFHSTQSKPSTISERELALEENRYRTTNANLSCLCFETSEQIFGHIAYNPELFHSSTIERFIKYFTSFLLAIFTYPRKNIFSIPLSTDSENQQLCRTWNNTQSSYPKDKNIHRLFEKQVIKTPEAIALTLEDNTLSYADLNYRSNQLAHYLIEQGVTLGSTVALCLERSFDMVISILAIVKAGAAYLPIDPEYPEQRVGYMLRDSNAKRIITYSKLNNNIPKRSKDLCVYINDYSCLSAIENQPFNNPMLKITANNPAYIIYTSGSTGKPKGVIVSHQAVNRLVFNSKYLDLEAGLNLLQVSSIAFDAATFELWGSLLHGGRCVLYPARVPEPEKLETVVRKNSIDAVFLTSSLFNLIVDVQPQLLNNIKQVLTGGEVISVKHINHAYQHCPNTQIIHVYGPTESTTFSSYYPIPRSINPKAQTIAIGRPLANTTLYLFDPEMNLVPIEMPGELYIGGDGLAIGYLNRPELTAEKFITQTINGKKQRLYKTGDLARWQQDGNIEYLERIDNQVKIRGHRIELGEIELALSHLEGIQSAAVNVHDRQYIIAYVTLEPGAKEDKSRLSSELKLTLPSYMLPAAFIFLATLPINTSGKTDYKALPAPNITSFLNTQNYIAPQGQTEKALAAIWSGVLKIPIEKIGIEDNFFDLGGHSLSATQVATRIRKTTHLDITIADIFKYKTIRILAARLGQAKTLSTKNRLPLTPQEQGKTLPLSFSQQRLWFLNQYEQDDISYNIPWAFRLVGELNITALTNAFTTIIQRHESLRTIFKTFDGNAKQEVIDCPRFTLPLIEVGHQDVDNYCFIHATHIFNLAEGPLLQASLLKLSHHEYILLINIHHIVFDGWSVNIFNRELTRLYSAYKQGKPNPLEPLSLQYTDFAHWQRQYLQGTILEQQLDYWKKQLQGIPEILPLPTDKPRPAKQRFKGHYLSFQLPKSLSQQLQHLSRKTNTTLYMVLLTAFSLLLARYTRTEDICLGSPIANRQRPELEGLIGFFANTLVMRVLIKENISFSALLEQVKNTTLTAYQHQDVPFEYLVETLEPERSTSYSPLFQVLFALHHSPSKEFQLDSLTLSPINNGSPTSKFDLSCHCFESEQGITVGLEYNTDLFYASTIERLFEHFQTLLMSIVSDSKQTIFTLSLMPSQQYQQISYHWNNTKTNWPSQHSAHQQFEQQATATPAAIALTFNDQSLSYQRLNCRSNQLAHYLIEQGVSKNSIVAICLERSFDMIISILAILKSGASYLPIDPNFPQQRIDYMLAHAKAQVLIYQQNILQKISLSTSYSSLCIDNPDVLPAIEKQTISNPETLIDDESTAYILYTSGSTGDPKGVTMPHRALSNLIYWQRTQSSSTIGTKTLQYSPIIFDVSFQEIFSTLSCGATLVLINEEERRDFIALSHLVCRLGIHRLFMPFIALQQFTEAADNVVMPALKEIITAGEQLQITPKIKTFFKRHQQATLFNHYGPTETHVVTALALDRNIETWDTLPTIGRPIANNAIYLLDPQRSLVPVGIPGELCVSGDGLATGYLHSPEITAEKFITHTINGCTQRLYKTGDLARWREDGNIEYLGRIDNQVKIRGYRIELGEVEVALSDLNGVHSAAVCIYQQHYLVAYIVLEEGTTQDSVQLREPLRTRLPDYMLPTTFVFLDKLPLTASGKINRKALPPPINDSLPHPNKYVAPLSRIEKCLVAIWSQVLNLEAKKIGIDDNFFELGGHSISLVRIISLCQKKGISLSIKNVYDAPSIRQLAILATVLEKNTEIKKPNLILENEIKVADHITAKQLPAATIDNPSTIFLTGATGFVGAFLLDKLLSETTADIYCLVRGNCAQSAEERLKSTLKNYQIYNQARFKRIVVINGDLSLPKFGLSDTAFDQLSENVEMIIHNGALVNHIFDYDYLKAANVGGTHTILELATNKRLKMIHFISILVNASVKDKDFYHHLNNPKMGYVLSKYVAEKMINVALSRGIRISIHRLGMISGHTHTGVSNATDRICLFLAACIELNCIPDLKGLQSILAPALTPVDFVTDFILSVLQQKDAIGKTFNVNNPHPIDWKELYIALQESGYTIDCIPLADWLQKISIKSQQQPNNVLLEKLVGLYVNKRNNEDIMKFSTSFNTNSNTYFKQDNTEVKCATINSQVIKKYLQYLFDCKLYKTKKESSKEKFSLS